jgi:hypothetical protein
MDAGALIVMILALLALIGVVFFLVYDYLKHKDSNIKDFDTEKKDRLSNLKFVVDQVNYVNNDIYDTVMSNVNRLDTSLSNINVTQSGMLDGIDTFLKFSSSNSNGTFAVDLLDLPGAANPDVKLMQHMNVMMGLTVKDLDGTEGNVVEFCSRADPTRCVQFPDADGNVVLKGLTTSGKVKVDSQMQLSSSLLLTGNSTGVAGSTPQTVSLSSSSDGTALLLNNQQGNVAVGTLTNPTAKLHVKADTGVPAFKVTTPNASEALLVSADGTLVTSQPILMKKNLTDQSAVATFSIERDSANADYLKVLTHRLHVEGDLSVSGTATVNGRAVQTAAA